MSPAAPGDKMQTGGARVGVVLVNWNNWRDCVECLDTLLESSHPSFHIVLVDNDSHDSSIEQIAQWCDAPLAQPGWLQQDGVGSFSANRPAPVSYRIVEWHGQPVPPPASSCRVTLVRSGGNLGFAGGNNVGIRIAGLERFDYFWLLNTDTIVDRAALSELVARASKDAAIGMVGSTLRYYDRPERIQGLGGCRLDPLTTSVRPIGEGRLFTEVPQLAAAAEAELAYVIGASMLVSAAFVREIGFMQEDYFLYFEEIDWAFRGRPRYTLAYAPESRVFHKAGGSSAKVASWFSLGHLYRNRIRFVGRFMPDRLPATKRQLAFEAMKLVVKGQWRRAALVSRVVWHAERLAHDARLSMAAP